MNHKDMILRFQQQIDELEKNRVETVQKIGLLLLETDSLEEALESLPEERREAIPEAISKARQITGQIQETSETLNELRHSLEQDKAIGQELKRNADTRKELERQEDGLFFEIGQRALEVYTAGPERFREYQNLFAAALQAQERFYELSNHIEKKELANRGKSPIQNVINKGLALADQVKRGSAERKLHSELKELGAGLVATDFPDRASSKTFQAAHQPYLTIQAQREELSSSKDELESRRRVIQAFLNDLKAKYGSSSPDRLISIIEDDLERLQNESSQSLQTAGAEYFEALPAKQKQGKKSASQVDRFVNQLLTVEQSMTSLHQEIARHRSAIKAQELKKRITQLQSEEERLARQITEKQAQLDKTSDLLQEAEKEYTEAAREAGPALSGESEEG
ncbi:coiled-coil domain-containing protein [Spirochaeta lutea]|nr:hypothetical protein [Spirochaeta lutea]